MSRWTVLYYQTRDGRKPVREWVQQLVRERRKAAIKVTEKFKLISDQYGLQGALDTELLTFVTDAEKILELKVWGTDLRVLMFQWRDDSLDNRPFLLAASAEIKKQDDLSNEVIRKAEDRRRDWFERDPNLG